MAAKFTSAGGPAPSGEHAYARSDLDLTAARRSDELEVGRHLKRVIAMRVAFDRVARTDLLGVSLYIGGENIARPLPTSYILSCMAGEIPGKENHAGPLYGR